MSLTPAIETKKGLPPTPVGAEKFSIPVPGRSVVILPLEENKERFCDLSMLLILRDLLEFRLLGIVVAAQHPV